MEFHVTEYGSFLKTDMNPNVYRANLSNDYFTNRQDRYFVFEDCPALATFYHNLIQTVSRYCLQLNADDSTAMPTTTSVHPYQVSQNYEMTFIWVQHTSFKFF